MKAFSLVSFAFISSLVLASPLAQIPPAAPVQDVPAVNGNGSAPDTKEDGFIKAGKAEKMVDKALDKVKDSVDGLDVAIKGIKIEDRATLGPLAESGEEVGKVLKVSTIQVERAGKTDIKGAFKIKETSEGLFVSLNAVADDLIEKKPAIMEAGLGMTVVKMLMEQKESAEAMMNAVVGSLPEFIQKEAKAQIEKQGNPIDRVIKEFSVGEMPPEPAPLEPSPAEPKPAEPKPAEPPKGSPVPTVASIALPPMSAVPVPTTMASVALPPSPHKTMSTGMPMPPPAMPPTEPKGTDLKGTEPKGKDPTVPAVLSMGPKMLAMVR